MRSIVKYLTESAVVAAMALAVGCDADFADFAVGDNEINPEEGVTSDPNSGDGTFDISSLLLSINTDSEMIATKASSYDEADDYYLVFIHNEDTGEELYRNTYATTKSLTEPLSLSVGNYIISATSIEEVPATAWDAPEYASQDRTFTIGADKTTTIEDEIVCTMSNIKTSVEISADLKALFDVDNEENPLQVLLDMGDANITYSASETRNGYFAKQEDNNTINVTMSGMYNTAADGEEPDYAYIEWKQEITDVTEGQARDISVQVAHYNEGVLEIKFVVTTWAYDETLGVQMSQAFYTSYESEIYDPDSDASDPYSAVVALNGASDYEYFVYPTSLDEETLTYSPDYTVTMTPQFGATISTATVEFTSTNSEIVAALNETGLGSSMALWSNGSANSDFSEWVSLSNSAGVLSATITYEGMKSLSSYSGTHTLKLVVVDSEDRRSVTPLVINSIISDKLDIIWDGYSFDDDHEISYYTDEGGYTELPVVFSITSKTGLTKLNIDIDSAVLTAAELAKLSLAQSMDLINPATPEMVTALEELGFPTGDAIEGSVMLTFDITSFMPLLAMLSPEGSKDKTIFTITAGDDSTEEDCVKYLTVIRK